MANWQQHSWPCSADVVTADVPQEYIATLGEPVPATVVAEENLRTPEQLSLPG